MKGFNGISLYQSCGLDNCECKVFNLVCLVRNGPELDIFTLESFDFDASIACSSDKCLCNTSEDGWPYASRVATANGLPLPSPVFADLPSYPELELASEFDL